MKKTRMLICSATEADCPKAGNGKRCYHAVLHLENEECSMGCRGCKCREPTQKENWKGLLSKLEV